jgi:hypothetical protein
MMFTEDCAKQGTITQLRRKYKDEEELSKLRKHLEAAFILFQVCSSFHKYLRILSRDCCQLDSHVRIEKALNNVLTTTDTTLATSNTILTTTNNILPTANAILKTTHTALTATQILLTVAETGASSPYIGDDV